MRFLSSLLFLLCWCPLVEGFFLFSLFGDVWNFLFPPALTLSFALTFDGYAALAPITNGETYDAGPSTLTEITLRADLDEDSDVSQVEFDYTFSGDDGETFSLLVTDSDSPFVLSEEASPVYMTPGEHQLTVVAEDSNQNIIRSKTISWTIIDSNAD